MRFSRGKQRKKVRKRKKIKKSIRKRRSAAEQNRPEAKTVSCKKEFHRRFSCGDGRKYPRDEAQEGEKKEKGKDITKNAREGEKQSKNGCLFSFQKGKIKIIIKIFRKG